MKRSRKSNDFEDAKREQTSVLAGVERAALRELARRMPAWVNSDHLSLLGLVSMFLAGVGYALSRQNPLMLHLVNLCIFLNWFGDSLDGTLARYRDRQRPRYGFYVDHIIDTFGTMFLIVGLALSGYMTERVAAAALIVFLMLAINSYLAAYSLGIFKISQWKMGPTEMRLLLIIGNIFLVYRPHARIFGHQYLLYDVGGVIAIVWMALVLVTSAIQNTRALYELERLPGPPLPGGPNVQQGGNSLECSDLSPLWPVSHPINQSYGTKAALGHSD
jgi:archaetidylinositol phosphate synthase